MRPGGVGEAVTTDMDERERERKIKEIEELTTVAHEQWPPARARRITRLLERAYQAGILKAARMASAMAGLHTTTHRKCGHEGENLSSMEWKAFAAKLRKLSAEVDAHGPDGRKP